MDTSTLLPEEKLIRRNSQLSPVGDEFRSRVLLASRDALVRRRRKRQQLLAAAAGLCLVGLSIWRISVTSHTPSPGAVESNRLSNFQVVPTGDQPASESAPKLIPPVRGEAPAMPVPPVPGKPGGLFQGPLIGFIGASDPRLIEEQLQSRQKMILRVLKQM